MFLNTTTTALIGALLGLGLVWMGQRFHVGSWYLDGPWSYAVSAVWFALVALGIRWAMRKEFGWP